MCVASVKVQEQWRISFGSEMSTEDWTSWERLLPHCLRSKQKDVHVSLTGRTTRCST